MRGLLRRVGALRTSFGANREGQVAVTSALALLPSLLMVGAAVDYGRAVAKRASLQQATDATVLAISHNELSSTSTVASLTGPTQTYLSGLINGAAIPSGGLTLAPGNTQICLSTTLNVPTTIMGLANVTTVPVGARSCAKPASSTTMEIALALDNSGSMSESAGGSTKMAALIQGAQQLVDTMIPSGTTTPRAAISIVPFTAVVNVGASSPPPAFVDTAGTSSIHWQNFHRPAPIPVLAPFYPTSKFDLLAALSPKGSWGGCVEERPVPYTTSDTPANTATPDTMFVPFLSPDDPGDTNPNDCFFVNPAVQLVSTSCSFGTLGPGLLNTHLFYNSYLADTGAVNLNLGNTCLLNPLSVTNDTIKLPLLASDNQPNYFPAAGATMVCKYNQGKVVSVTSGPGVTTGPNFLCSGPALTPLTTDRSVLTTAINAMKAGGSTDLAAGTMWAWRTISPVAAMFPVSAPGTIGPQNPKSYATSTGASATNAKYLILMTDGFNSWTQNAYSPWGSTYEAFGYYVNNRIASYGDCNNPGYFVPTTASTYRCQLDNVTREACTNAKAAGITIYTVGFTISSDPIDAQGISLLQSCASSTADYFQASDAAGLVNAFQQIAANIQGLRLTQ
ncbi:putative von willebrand factor type a [Beijerinckiaceae bacterium RH CH11]|nr:putative von willebrand factor type a [Beijerinckiaceae bacterium RH CH11]VVB49518.1 putative von willebrand factor type a [Beijerinckiaceae bacterium RH AL8]